MRSWMSVVGLAVVAGSAIGCGGVGAPKMTSRADVAGTVNLGGKPLNEPESLISFALPGEAPALIPIKEGKFEGKAPVGESRVEIRAMKEGKPVVMAGKPVEGSGKYNFIAPQFNDKSTLTAKVPAAGVKDLRFDVEAGK